MIKEADKKSLLNSAGTLALAAILVKMIGLFYKVFLSHLLGDEGMGYFNAAYTVYSFLYLLGSAGVPKAITLLVSESLAKGDEEEARRLFYIARRFFLRIGLVLFLFLLLFARPLCSFIGSPHAYATVLLISPCLLFVSLGGVYRGYLGAKESFSPSAVASVLEGALKLALGLGFVFVGEYYSFSLPYLSAFSVLSITVATMISTLYLRSNIKISNNISRQNCKEGNRRIIKIALPLALGSAATGASSLVDLGMIMRRLEEGGMSAEAATAAYGNYTTLAVPMLQLVASLISPLAVVLLPRLSSFHSLQGKEAFFSCLQFGMKSVAFFSVPIAAVFFFFSEPLLMLIFPSESARIAAPLLGMLSLAVLFLSALFIVNTALEAVGKVHLQMLSLLIGIIVKIPVTYILLANPSVGIAAAPIGTVFSYAASLLFSLVAFGKRGAILRIFSAHALPFLNTAAACIGAFFAFGIFDFLEFSALKAVLAFFVFSAIYLFFSFLTGAFFPSKQKIRQNNQISV